MVQPSVLPDAWLPAAFLSTQAQPTVLEQFELVPLGASYGLAARPRMMGLSLDDDLAKNLPEERVYETDGVSCRVIDHTGWVCCCFLCVYAANVNGQQLSLLLLFIIAQHPVTNLRCCDVRCHTSLPASSALPLSSALYLHPPTNTYA